MFGVSEKFAEQLLFWGGPSLLFLVFLITVIWKFFLPLLDRFETRVNTQLERCEEQRQRDKEILLKTIAEHRDVFLNESILRDARHTEAFECYNKEFIDRLERLFLNTIPQKRRKRK